MIRQDQPRPRTHLLAHSEHALAKFCNFPLRHMPEEKDLDIMTARRHCQLHRSSSLLVPPIRIHANHRNQPLSHISPIAGCGDVQGLSAMTILERAHAGVGRSTRSNLLQANVDLELIDPLPAHCCVWRVSS